MAEAETNLAINVIPGLSESYEVQGRGELQLGELLLNSLVSAQLLFVYLVLFLLLFVYLLFCSFLRVKLVLFNYSKS